MKRWELFPESDRLLLLRATVKTKKIVQHSK